MWNLIHFDWKSTNGNFFDRFVRNCGLWPTNNKSNSFGYKDLLIENVDETLSGKNIILWSSFFQYFDLYEKYFEKFKNLLKFDNFIFLVVHEHECATDTMFNHIWNNLRIKELDESLQKKVYITSYDHYTEHTHEVWQKESNVVSYMKPVFFDNFLYENLDLFFEGHKILHTEQFENKKRTHRYVCYNADPKDYRVRLVNDLFSNDLDKFGLISLLRKENPLVLDREEIQGWDPSTHIYPMKHFFDTYFSVVTESYFKDWHDNKPRSYAYISGLSEKTFKAMLLNPFIILGGYHSLNRLHELGFKTFPELFDESYDNIFDPKERYNKIFSNILNVCNMTENKLNDLYHSVLVDKVKYNQQLYLNYDRKSLFNTFMRKFKWN
jgi:hypothetical protein